MNSELLKVTYVIDFEESRTTEKDSTHGRAEPSDTAAARPFQNQEIKTQQNPPSEFLHTIGTSRTQNNKLRQERE